MKQRYFFYIKIHMKKLIKKYDNKMPKYFEENISTMSRRIYDPYSSTLAFLAGKILRNSYVTELIFIYFYDLLYLIFNQPLPTTFSFIAY